MHHGVCRCGYPPFWGDTEYDVANSILHNEVVLDEDDWSHVSDNGKRLVLGLLERNPHRRLTVDDILKHTWTYASKSINEKASKSFVATVAMRRIRKASMGVFETDSKRMNYLYRNYKDSDGHSANHHMHTHQGGGHQEHHANGSLTRPRRIENASSANSATSESLGSESARSCISPLSSSPMHSQHRHSILALESQMSESYSYSNMTLGSYDRSDRGDSMSFTDMVRRYSKTDDDLFELRLPHNMNYTPRDYALEDSFFGLEDDELRLDLQRPKSTSMKRKYSQ